MSAEASTVGPASSEPRLRAAVVGMAATATSGMRDHARLLSGALAGHGIDCSEHWLTRTTLALRPARAEVSAWAQGVGEELAASRPDAVLLHYASFAYSYRGLPIFLPGALSAARRSGGRIVAIMHELVYPWGWGEDRLRGNVWALAQRLALLELMRTSSAAVVTFDRRARWIGSQRWLPRRPIVVAPVFSNLPRARPGVRPAEGLLGLFGYAYEGVARELVLDTLAQLRAAGADARLQLLGAPGPGSAHGLAWRAAAERRGLSRALAFSDVLPAQELADAIAGCAVLLCAAAQGPTPTRGTLAASLASGRPVVAIDGPRTWSELIQSEAALLVAPTAAALAGALARVLADEPGREALGARGRAFYEQRMALELSAELISALLREGA